MGKSKHIAVLAALVLCFVSFKISIMEKGSAGSPPEYDQPRTPGEERMIEINGRFLSFSPNQSKALLRDNYDNKTIYVYDLNNGNLLNTFKSEESITQALWINDSKILVRLDAGRVVIEQTGTSKGKNIVWELS